jgi:hypothetical protein
MTPLACRGSGTHAGSWLEDLVSAEGQPDIVRNLVRHHPPGPKRRSDQGQQPLMDDDRPLPFELPANQHTELGVR